MSPQKQTTAEIVIEKINAKAVNWFMGIATTGIITCIGLLWNIQSKLIELTEREKVHTSFEVQQDKLNDFLQTAAASHTVRISVLETKMDNLKPLIK